MAQEEQEGLLGFNWEGDGEDFFGVQTEESTETSTKEKTEEKEQEESKEEKEETQETKEEKSKVESFFEQEEQEQEKEETSSSKETNTNNIYDDLYKDLKEQGIFKHVELEEGEEIDPDKLFELQQQEYEAEVSARLTAWATQDLDEDAQAFIKFKRDGGNTSDFFKAYSSTSDIPTGDISEENVQDKVIRYQLKQEGWDSEEIEDRLKYLTESGKKEVVAQRYNNKIEEQTAKSKQQALKQAEQAKQAAIQQEQEFKTGIKSVLNETKDINGVKITPKDKTNLYNFLTKKSHKISDSRSVTGFQKKLSEAFQDTNKMILLAKLVSSDFNMKEFEKATVTKKTKQIKSNLEQRKNLRPNNSGSSLEGNSLADLFN